jgi:coenzyme F420-dependent glucose-6-phosphate dehydrogenase
MDSPSIGYWAAHEQYSMQDLLSFVIEAEKGGFDTTMTSDHFHPWWHSNAHGNFSWVWMTLAAERTKKMRFVTGVTAPVHRYHPAIIAQAFASLDVLFPGRVALGLGTGEAMNELPLGFDWPGARVRLAKTKEALEIIRLLWQKPEYSTSRDEEGFVTYNGEYFRIRDAKLYTPPVSDIPIFMAAAGPESTKLAAKYSDGLITYLNPERSNKILSLFDQTARGEGRDTSKLQKAAEFKLSYSDDYNKAFQSAAVWRATLIKGVFNSKISDPRKLESRAKLEVSDKMVTEAIKIFTSIEDCMGTIEDYFRAGFTKVYIHSSSPNELEFVRAFSKIVLRYFGDRIGS